MSGGRGVNCAWTSWGRWSPSPRSALAAAGGWGEREVGGGGEERGVRRHLGPQGRAWRGEQAVRSAPAPSSFPLQPPTFHLCPPTGFSKNNKNIWHMVRGKRVRNLWALRSRFRQRWRHAAAVALLAPRTCSHTQAAIHFDPPGMCTLLAVSIAVRAVSYKSPGKRFLLSSLPGQPAGSKKHL